MGNFPVLYIHKFQKYTRKYCNSVCAHYNCCTVKQIIFRSLGVWENLQYTIQYNRFLMCYAIRGFKGSEVQIFDHLFLVKEAYFEKPYRIKDAQNEVLNSTQPSKFR